jgi:formate dehydrogenase iron-sulfur subunit
MGGLSRRDFLRRGGQATAGAALTGGLLATTDTQAQIKVPDELGQPPCDEAEIESLAARACDQAAMLYDATICIGCRACELGCEEYNQLGRTEDEIFEGRPAEDSRALATDVYTYITFHEAIPGDPSSASFGKVQCMHCIEPACASSCPVSALEKTEEGPVIWHDDLCLGCRYCMMACPFLVPRFEWHKLNPRIQKCTMCYDRQLEGGIPACVEMCPTGSLLFGTREELLNEARTRIETNPRGYVHHIYGEREAGGTAFLHLAGQPFEDLGYRRNLPYRSYRDYTRPVMHTIPYILSGLGLVLGAAAWMTAEAEDAAAEHGKEAGDEE